MTEAAMRADLGPALRRVLDALHAHGSTPRRSGDGWQARCPAHDDQRPSLQVAQGRQGAVLRCFSGCSADAIVGALSLDMRDLFDSPKRRADAQPSPRDGETRSWEIRTADGRTVAVHHRRDLGPKRKSVWWTADGKNGLGGRKTTELPLYGADRIGQREPGDDTPLIVCEGEPATDALLSLGLRAVGTVTGASALPGPEPLEALRGWDVVLWPDSDATGRTHMAGIARLLDGVAASVKLFEPEGLPTGGDAVDWARERAETPNLATVLLAEIEAHAKSSATEASRFEHLDDDVGYRLTVPGLSASLEVTHLRRERHQLRGEVLTRCNLPGAATFDGVLSVADLNLSSARSRRDHANHLAEQAHSEEDPWKDAVEELSQRVLAAEREGEPDVLLPEVVAEPVRIVEVEGLRLPRQHPAVLFGDGDSAKSYLVLYMLGRLAQEGLRVGLADWELSEVDHRDRLGRLFPGTLPPVRYLRCARPIVHEADRLRRWVRDRRLDYVALDSVAYASAGAPESAEVAMAYFQVVRQLGAVGSLHVAHITKAEQGADRRPFGSAFWHNSPRATWYAKLADRDAGGTVSRLGLYPRKWNVGPLPAAVGLELSFGPDVTSVRRVDVADSPDLAAHLSVRQRMVAALRTGPMGLAELSEAIDAQPDTVRRTARRYRDAFGEGAGKTLHLVEAQR